VPQTDPAAIGDDNDFVVEGIIDIGQSLIDAGRGLIDFGRAFHVQGFVTTLLVEDLDKGIELGLLLKEIQCGRFGGFLFQGEMHALMAAILLRMTRFDAFNADSQPEPLVGNQPLKDGVYLTVRLLFVFRLAAIACIAAISTGHASACKCGSNYHGRNGWEVAKLEANGSTVIFALVGGKPCSQQLPK